MLPQRRAEARFISVVAAGVVAVSAFVLLRRERAAPRGRVTVTVYDEGSPASGRWVIFQDPEGAVVRAERSGADGKASADVAAGSMVTVALGTSLRALTTIAGVQPGDALTVGEAEEDESVAAVVGTARVRFPSAYPGAVAYTASLGVGATEAVDPTAPVPLPVLARFLVGGEKFAALGQALDASGAPLAYAFAWVPWDAAAKPGAEVDARLGAWSRDFRTFEIALVNAPPGARAAEVRFAILAHEDDRFETRPARVDLSGGRGEATFHAPRPLGAEALSRVELAFGGSDEAILVRREEVAAARAEIDLSAALLPRVSSATVAPTPLAARPLVAWKVAGDAGGADALVARVAWPATREHVWTIVAPPGTTRLRLPALPDALAAWRPDGRATTVAAALVDTSSYAGFEDVRRKGTQRLLEPAEDEHGASTLRASTTGDFDF